jgi:phosphopantothenoylcysteine synthetase/decarboxylase
MGAADNAVSIITRDGGREDLGKAPKMEIADHVLDAALRVLRASGSGKKVS